MYIKADRIKWEVLQTIVTNLYKVFITDNQPNAMVSVDGMLYQVHYRNDLLTVKPFHAPEIVKLD